MSLKKAEFAVFQYTMLERFLGQTEAHRFQTFDIFDTVFSLF